MKQAIFIKKKRKGNFETEKANLQFKQNPKIHREKQKEKWAKQAREKVKLTFTISSAFSLFGRVMKTLVSQRLAKYVINSLLLCSARRDVNKIRKSKSRMKSPTKSRRNVSTLQEAFPIMTPYALRYRFPKTFQPDLAFFFNISQFFRGKLNITTFLN